MRGFRRMEIWAVRVATSAQKFCVTGPLPMTVRAVSDRSA